MILHNQVVALNLPEDVCVALNNLKGVTVIGKGGESMSLLLTQLNKLKLIITKSSPMFALQKKQQAQQVVFV